MKTIFEPHELDLIVSGLRGTAGSLLAMCESPMLADPDKHNMRMRGFRMQNLADAIVGATSRSQDQEAGAGIAAQSINNRAADVQTTSRDEWEKQQAERRNRSY